MQLGSMFICNWNIALHVSDVSWVHLLYILTYVARKPKHKIHFKVILPSNLTSFPVSVYRGFPLQNLACICFSLHMSHAPPIKLSSI